MTALGNVCNQTLDLIFYTYHNSATRSFILILVLDDMRHLAAHFSPSPWLHPCVERIFRHNLSAPFKKYKKQKFCKFWAELFPPSMCSLQKSGKTELQNFDRIYSRHLPVPCNTATRDPDTWGNNEMKEKTFKGSYSYKIRWSSEICLKSESSPILSNTLTSKNITKEAQNLCSNCNWQTPGQDYCQSINLSWMSNML